MRKLLCALLLLSSLYAQENPTAFKQENSNYLLVDRYLSSYIGGEDLITTHHALAKCEELFFSTPQERTFLAGSLRFADQLFIWLPINYTTMVVQHEYFGHGYRLREFGTHDIHYQIGTPPPYGEGGGATSVQLSHPLELSQMCIVSSGGVEATAVLANRLKLHWLQSNNISAKESSLYLLSQHDLTDYVSNAFDLPYLTGHDMSDYIYLVNESYPKGRLTKKRLQKLSLINLADPFTYYAIYSSFRYIFIGHSLEQIPMIPLGKARYLPGLRLGLSPFGPEYYVENYLVYKEKPTYFYLKLGSFGGNTFYGLGIDQPELFRWRGQLLGFRVDLWRQPPFNTNKEYSRSPWEFFLKHYFPSDEPQEDNASSGNQKIGGAVTLLYDAPLAEKFALHLHAELGYKTTGYLPANNTKSGAIARIGLRGTF